MLKNLFKIPYLSNVILFTINPLENRIPKRNNILIGFIFFSMIRMKIMFLTDLSIIAFEIVLFFLMKSYIANILTCGSYTQMCNKKAGLKNVQQLCKLEIFERIKCEQNVSLNYKITIFYFLEFFTHFLVHLLLLFFSSIVHSFL